MCDFAPRKPLFTSTDIFFLVVTSWDATGMLLNKHPAMHRTAPTGGPKRSILPRNGVLG